MDRLQRVAATLRQSAGYRCVGLAISWAILVVACLFRLALAINRLRLLHRSARPLTVSTNLASRRKITIAESSRISSPVAVGLWSPKVLLPSNFVFTAEDREHVLRHEIAHLERFDDWLNFAQ
jgi:bla regulator protein blaR1